MCPANLKEYVKKASPYSWNDISDNAKHEAIIQLSSSGSTQTQPFWDRGLPDTERDMPNLLAGWFLFRRFRLAGMHKQKRYGGVQPVDTDYIFIAPTGKAAHIQSGKCCLFLDSDFSLPCPKDDADMQLEHPSVPSASHVHNTSGRDSRMTGWQNTLVERGRMCAEPSRPRPRSDLTSLEEASVTE